MKENQANQKPTDTVREEKAETPAIPEQQRPPKPDPDREEEKPR
jgi:hypothetical protein